MIESPRGIRLHIGIYGRRNVGKSSLINAIAGQNVSIVSDIPGTTTDVVSKPIEIKPIGPVVFFDTAGIDDLGELGEKRVKKTLETIDRVDIALLIITTEFERSELQLLDIFKTHNLPFAIIINKIDENYPETGFLETIKKYSSQEAMLVAAKLNQGIVAIKERINLLAPQDFLDNTRILSELVSPKDVILLVVPIDLEAPKGRLILPQVQIIREVLDNDAKAIIVKEYELAEMLASLKISPRLVVTDSQVILKVCSDVPENIPVTTFSILFARWKGDLDTFVKGVEAIDNLKSGDKVLIFESCSHHPIGEDIGRVKIPRWITKYTNVELQFDYYTGHDLPNEFAQYKMIIHCGGCMTNRREILSRILKAQQAGVPITNYGLVISKAQGVLNRVLKPFNY